MRARTAMTTAPTVPAGRASRGSSTANRISTTTSTKSTTLRRFANPACFMTAVPVGVPASCSAMDVLNAVPLARASREASAPASLVKRARQ